MDSSSVVLPDTETVWKPVSTKDYGAESVRHRETQIQDVKAHIDSLANQYSNSKLLRATMLPNAEMHYNSYNKETEATGVTYVFASTAKAQPLLKHMGQLGGTVSAYALGPKSHEWMQTAKEQLAQLAQSTTQDAAEMQQQNRVQIFDTSFERGQQAASRRAAVPHPSYPQFDLNGLDTLGPDGQISLHTESYLSSEPAPQNPVRYLIVKQQFAGADRAVFSESTTLGELAASREYKTQEMLSQQSANHLAYKVAVALGEIDSQSESCKNEYLQPSVLHFSEDLQCPALKPSNVNRYNTLLQRSGGQEFAGHKQVIYVHYGTLNTVHGGRGNKLMISAGRNGGYLMVPVDSRGLQRDANTGQYHIRLSNRTSSHSYPMAYPQRLPRQSAQGTMLQAESDRNALKQKISNGSGLLDVRTLPDMNYAQLYHDEQWRTSMRSCGSGMELNSTVLALDAAIHIAPSMGVHVGLQELVEFHANTQNGLVQIHLDHPFVTESLMRSLAHARTVDPSMTLNELQLQQDGRNHVLLNAKALARMLQL